MNMIQKKCAFHINQNLVNFCRNPQCMLPMCPSCVKIHSAEHVRQNTHGNYDCIADLHTQVQTTLQTTMQKLISNGSQLKQAFKAKQSQKIDLMNKLKQMRAKVMESVNKYIDSLQSDLLNQFSCIEGLTQEQFSQVDLKIHSLSEQASKELYNLNNQKEMKAIINHISAKMPQYYSYKLNEISSKINQIKKTQINIEKQFKGNQISQALRLVGQCYNLTFFEPLKRRSQKSLNLIDSNVSKGSKGSTQGSYKKVL